MGGRSTGRVTIQHVAAHAGVGTMTVSRVVRNVGYVSEEVRTRVKAAMHELGYVPNELARGLRSRQSGTLALILSDITNPFFTTAARGAEDAASDAGYLTLLCNTDESEVEEARYLRLLAQKRVDGALLVPARSGVDSIAYARRHEVKIVVMDRSCAVPGVDVVRCDSESASQELGDLLYRLGHRRMAILTGAHGATTAEMRVAGFLRAMANRPDVAPIPVLYGEFTRESGLALTKQALSTPPRPTALFAANNFLSIGTVQQLRAMGLRVPEDVSVVGFDDLPEPLMMFPFLTVAVQPAYEMGRLAMERLLAQLGDDPPAPRETILPTPLVVRASTAPPP